MLNVSPNSFDREYFEDGISTNKSGYENYRWLPELTIRMAHKISKYLLLDEKQKIIEHGCAKGFLVKALRILDFDCYGFDVSEYAIEHCDPEVREYCHLAIDDQWFYDTRYDWLISKDVFEHMYESEIDSLLEEANKKVLNMFAIIPLGDQGVFRIRKYHNDETHVQIQNEEWWIDKFRSKGWDLVSMEYRVKGVKDNWYKVHDKGNAFFVFKNNSRLIG